MKMNYCIITLSLLACSPLLAMDTDAPAPSSAAIVITGAVARSSDKVGSPVLGRSNPLRYSRNVLESLAGMQNDEDKKQREQFVNSISGKIDELKATVEAVKAAKDGEQQSERRKNLMRSTP